MLSTSSQELSQSVSFVEMATGTLVATVLHAFYAYSAIVMQIGQNQWL
jgi:hypothetical protein